MNYIQYIIQPINVFFWAVKILKLFTTIILTEQFFVKIHSIIFFGKIL